MRSMKLTVLHDFYAILKTENWNIMIPNLIKPCCSRQTPHKIKRRAVEKFYRYLVVNAGSDPAGCDRPPLKPTKVTLFTMILYYSEKSVRAIRPFCRPYFVTAVLWTILHLSCSSEPVMRLDYQILQKSTPLTLLTGPPLGELNWSYREPSSAIVDYDKQDWRFTSSMEILFLLFVNICKQCLENKPWPIGVVQWFSTFFANCDCLIVMFKMLCYSLYL